MLSLGRGDRAVALATVDRPVQARFERYFRLDATGGTDGRVHSLAGASAASCAAPSILLSGCAAVWTSLGLIDKALVSEELLLAGTEGEIVATVGTLQLFVGVHWMTSFLKNL